MIHEFASDLSWKIFLDRYALKDIERRFEPGDLALVVIEPDPRWPKKDIGRVEEVQADGILRVLMLTGPLAGDVLERRPVDCDRPLETSLNQAARRIAGGVASVEEAGRRDATEASFAEEIESQRFVPAGRIWSGAGTDHGVTFFNCYVIPSPKDSREGIITTLGQMIEIMARGGGVGINISSLRPTRAPVRGVNGRSSGAVSWMDLYSRATGLVEQGGSRRGALMLQIDDWHPDVLRFINAKRTPGMVENANISVRVSDGLMQAVKDDVGWELVFPDTSDPDYDTTWDGDLKKWLAAGKETVVRDTVRAREIWEAIVESAWASAEPGVIFSDRSEELSNSWYFNPLICTNPCAEQPLPAWGVCTLGHINLARFVTADGVDWDQLKVSIRTAVRFLDDVVDATPYFMEENRENQQRERRVGLGTMGLGELLIKVGKRYGSQEAVEFVDNLYRFIAEAAYAASADLAQEKGSFPAFDAEKFLQSGFMQGMPEHIRQLVARQGIRNVTLITQAPTGTVGTMVGTSTGIEPFYAFKYVRQSRLGLDEQYVPIAQEWLDAHPGEQLPDYFVGAMDLSPEEHVRIQAAIQRWTDSSISKTANAPESYTAEETKRLYELAYDLGCKGVTIYRDKSRHEQVLHLEKAQPETEMGPEVHPVPAVINGHTYRVDTPAGTTRIVINESDGEPFEVFLLLGRAGSEVQSFMEALGRIMSVFLRTDSRIPARRRLRLLADQLQGIGGANQMGLGPGRVLSVVDALGQVLNRHLNGNPSDNWGLASQVAATRGGDGADLCPQCGSPTFVHEEGCAHCTSCGYSRC